MLKTLNLCAFLGAAVWAFFIEDPSRKSEIYFWALVNLVAFTYEGP
jgi:hypothetical protein